MAAPSEGEELARYAIEARRNEIAIVAMQGLLAGPRGASYASDVRECARRSHEIADAMLAEAGWSKP